MPPESNALLFMVGVSEADIGEVLLCRGTDNCLRFALQLGVLRRYGRFLEEYDDPPVRIVNHLAAQLHLPPAGGVNSSMASAKPIVTESSALKVRSW